MNDAETFQYWGWIRFALLSIETQGNVSHNEPSEKEMIGFMTTYKHQQGVRIRLKKESKL